MTRMQSKRSPSSKSVAPTLGCLILVSAAEQSVLDILLTAARRRMPESSLEFPKRITTRRNGPRDAEFMVSRKTFGELECDGGFLATWEADGQRFGLPVSVHKLLLEGRSAVVAAPSEIATRLQELCLDIRTLHLIGQLDSARVLLTPRACFRRVVGPRLAAHLEARGIPPRAEAITCSGDLPATVRALTEALLRIERERDSVNSDKPISTGSLPRGARSRSTARAAAL